MKLFCEDACSPFFRSSPKEWNISEEEFQAVITPYGKTSSSLFVDEDSGIGMEYDLVSVLFVYSFIYLNVIAMSGNSHHFFTLPLKRCTPVIF